MLLIGNSCPLTERSIVPLNIFGVESKKLDPVTKNAGNAVLMTKSFKNTVSMPAF